MNNLTTTVKKQRHPRKPVKYWEAYTTTFTPTDLGNIITFNIIDANNSIAILRSKYTGSVQYRAIR